MHSPGRTYPPGGRVMVGHSNETTDLGYLDFVLPDWQFAHIHSGLLPGLREHGVSEDQIDQMLVHNPREFFAAQ